MFLLRLNHVLASDRLKTLNRGHNKNKVRRKCLKKKTVSLNKAFSNFFHAHCVWLRA